MRPCLLLLLLFANSVAHAADPAVTLYPADYFTDSAPATAADMVARVPGFALVDADDEVRGYAGAQGNVLIDGARPASKRDSLDDLLGRIPAHAVHHIEVIRAGAAGHDLLGHAMLINVVRKLQAVTEGAVEAGVLFDAAGAVEPVLRAEAARQWGENSLDVSAGSEPEIDDDTGAGRRTTVASDGARLEDARSDVRRVQQLRHLSANWTQPWAGGEAGLFTALRDSRDRETDRVDSLLPTSEDAAGRQSEHLKEAELGLRWSRPLDARSTLEMLASQRTGWLDVRSVETEGDELETFAQDTRSSESIARFDLRQARSSWVSLNASLELALNALDGDATLIEDGELVELPGSRVRIEERRAEAELGAQWRTTDAWRFEAGLGSERSRIVQAGDSLLERDFVYWKPSVAARWQRNDAESWRLSLARDVGQLAFEDFVASASLDSDLVTAGNATLEPDKTWRLALAWERRFGRDGAITLTLAHDEISDVVDRVPVTADGEVFDAPGNIGGGGRDRLSLEFGTSLDAFGWETLRLDAAVLWQHGRVTDPSSDDTRGISAEKPIEGEIGLEQTLASRGLKWGVELELAEREPEYRFDEHSLERADASLELYVERALHPRWRLRAELVDPFGRDIVETRDRGGEVEIRQHRVPAQVMLTLRGEMGG